MLMEKKQKDRRILAFGAVLGLWAVYHLRKINFNLVKPLGLVFCHLQQNMILIDSGTKALETDLG